jgi:pyroglutamyl-peptidase
LWSKSPERLNSSLDVDEVLSLWRVNIGKVQADIRASDDVGSYVCGFIYYQSLEHFWKKGDDNRPVLFMHVPPLPKTEDVKTGVDIAIGLLQAVAETHQV